MLAVRNCCYVAVCSAARGASAPTRGGEGRGISWRPPAYSLFVFILITLAQFFFLLGEGYYTGEFPAISAAECRRSDALPVAQPGASKHPTADRSPL